MGIVTILVLAMASVTTLILFGMIYFGSKNSKQINALGENVDKSTSTMNDNLKQVLKSLEKNQAQQERILQRLVNLETIVTSEAWDTIKKDPNSEHIGLFLHDEESEELSTEEKTQNIAKRIKH